MVEHKHTFKIDHVDVPRGFESNLFAHWIFFKCACGARAQCSNAGLHLYGIGSILEAPPVVLFRPWDPNELVEPLPI